MTWDAVHRRGDVLREVVDEANQRLDGRLPLTVPGVRETFPDDLALVSALQLRWHTLLAGRIDTALLEPAGDLETSVLSAWRAAAAELAGVRMILDAHRAAPTSPAMAEALEKAHRKDVVLLAAMAGLANADDPSAVRVGERLEAAARTGYDPTATPRHRGADTPRPASLLGRLKAHLAA